MKLSATAIKAAAVGTVLGIAGTVGVLLASGTLPRAGQPAETGSAVAAPLAARASWVCPMGDYEGDRPGRCPKCGMELEKAAGEASESAAPGHEGHGGMAMPGHEGHGGMAMPGHVASPPPKKPAGAEPAAAPARKPAEQVAPEAPKVDPAKQKEVWVCPMGHIITDKPGDCPVCGMKLIKQAAQPAGTGPMVAGTVVLSAEKQQQIGVRTAEVGYATLGGSIRAAAKIDMDESRVSHVHTKIEGWIEDLLVSTTGQQVRQGQPLLTLYSPDLVAAQEEYLQAVRTERELGRSGLLPPGGGLAAAARSRLRNWDFGEADLEALRRSGVPKRVVPLASPRGGVVLEKKAVAGMRVMPGDDLYTIADLSTVWALAQVYESELPYVKLGATARVQIEAMPGRTFPGRITFVYPTVDPMTRTARVRVVLANPGLMLKPEMYATVTLATPAQRHLAIPSEAVLDSGARQVAFVAKPGGYFEPRVLKLGGYRGDLAVVKAGLRPGERVVTSANFLIDSESQLRAAMGDMQGGAGQDRGAGGHHH